MKRYLVYSILSVVLPGAAYAFAFLTGLAPGGLHRYAVLAPLLAINALGLALSLRGLLAADRRPTDTSSEMRFLVFLSTVSVFVNLLALQALLAETLFPIPPAPAG